VTATPRRDSEICVGEAMDFGGVRCDGGASASRRDLAPRRL
jgi:hypothetical protein